MESVAGNVESVAGNVSPNPIAHSADVGDRLSDSCAPCLYHRHGLDLISIMHAYEVRPRRDKRGVDLISDALPFGRLWYGEPNAVANAINALTAAYDALEKLTKAIREVVSRCRNHAG
jgi:hypothetical protein